MRVGIVSSEFLQPGVTRIGGFGWGAARAAEVLRASGDEPLFICSDVEALREAPNAIAGVPLIAKYDGALLFARALRRARPEVLLSVDYRPSYDTALKVLPRTPLVVWVRDPRPPEDVANAARIRIPGQPPDTMPAGLGAIDCTPLRSIVRRSHTLRRRVVFGSPAPDALTPKAARTYGFDPGPLALLPNPLDVARDPGPKAPAPRVVFLARLDAYKRPWVFVELARLFPDVEFRMVGQAHFSGPRTWEPRDLPANVQLLGNLSGEDKLRELDAAWVLVSTSAHEGLPVSFLEAWASRAPVLACVDTDRVVSRFGIYAGDFPGDGLAALPSLRAGLERLLGDHELRERLGAAGRAWVCGRHTPDRFLAAFRSLAAG
jgi:glycosyltransferase involved in cell wall biosynthesis